MTFLADKVEEFLVVFNSAKDKIRSFPGCISMELLNDINQPSVYVTISLWKSEEDLENYRNSELFKNTWSRTKALFAEKAQAFSLRSVDRAEN